MQYQLIHALALVLTGMLQSDLLQARAIRLAGWSFALGVLFFSGSLYLLALGGPTFLGPITPLGGIAFIVGWLALAVSAIGRRNE